MSKWLWIPLGLSVVAGMVWASVVAEHPEWERARRWLDERRQAWRQDGCPVVQGWPSEGCSRADYRAAASAAAALPEDLQRHIEFAIDSDWQYEGRSRHDELGHVVAAIRRGAGRFGDVDSAEPRLGQQAIHVMVDVQAMLVAFGALRLTARHTAQEDPQAAAEVLVDGLAAAVDLASAGIGVERIVGQKVALDVIGDFDDDLLGAIGREPLQRLGRALEDVGSALSVSDDFLERELAHKIVYLLEDRDLRADDLGVHRMWTWRHGFSLRSYAIAQVCDQLELVRASRHAADPRTSTWPKREATLRQLGAELARLPRDYLSMPDTTEIERTSRRASAALGQLRLAVAFHLRDPLPELPDPLGEGPIRVEIDGDAASFRSADAEIARDAVRNPR